MSKFEKYFEAMHLEKSVELRHSLIIIANLIFC